MRRIITLLSIILLATTISFSRTTYQAIEKDSAILITPQQLKETNLIFTEHKKLLLENSLLMKQIDNYKEDNALLVATDSIRLKQLNEYKKLNDVYIDKVNKLNFDLKKSKKKFLTVGGVTICVSLILLLVVK